ncbi:MAG: aromatic ring-hydroxylating dioxygenase subunit alpha [Proteobacteria bacterium]|nr:aromatic ring-hydroxylating dioxygenase subunit alpha [Pseudomonadota bacterium]
MSLPPPGLVRAATTAMRQMADANTAFLKNEWYVVAFADELQRSLLKRTVLGQRLVLFRTLAGVPVALDDRCAHRSFPLSAGTLEGDTVVCGYHGLRYDAAGDCIQVPSQKTCPKGIGVRAFPLVARGPFVWAWLGESTPDPSRIPGTPWLDGAEWTSSRGYFHLPANYVSLHENLLDLTHLSFVHARSFGTPDYAAAPYETSLEEGRFRITRTVAPTRLPPVWAKPTGLEHDAAARIATSEFVSPGLHVVTANFHDYRLPADKRAEFQIRTCHVPTPETHHSTHYFIVHSRDFALADAAVTRFMHDELFRAFEEDVVALTRLEEVLANPGAPFYEMSVASDAPSVAMRRYLLRRALEEQSP